MQKKHIVYDTELIGNLKPRFLVCGKILETGETFSLWHHKRGHTAKLEKMLNDPQYTWVSFNGDDFDRPLMCAAIMGYDEIDLKTIADRVITDGLRSWQTYREYKLDFIEFDHIDLREPAPGVMISLKLYAGRMGYRTMMDMPFDHRHDMTAAECLVAENYCFNDIGVTEMLFKRLSSEMELRINMSEEYGIDLRSKSDAQIAEALLKHRCGISNGEKRVPFYVRYSAPDFIKSRNPRILALIDAFESEEFKINRANGSPIEADWMSEPFAINNGMYKVGLGGLHSQHDKKRFIEADDEYELSDFDVKSYYPNIMMKAGLIPQLGGNKGEVFLAAYSEFYQRRIAAQKINDKKVANTYKIILNGTFGKLGSLFCSFYAPDLLIAVTITGQLNLLCLIDDLEKINGVTVESANTDGMMVKYPKPMRERVLKVFAANAKRTGFEYEETPYARVALKDVNNYIAIGTKGKIKSKGLYAESSLMKNPTMQVCSDAAARHLLYGISPEDFIEEAANDLSRIADFMAIRNVKGGGIQHAKLQVIDDWELVNDRGSKDNEWMRACWPDDHPPVRRKSRPAPVEVGVGGESFGRVARWYMTTNELPPISYVGSGNKVPKTEGAKVCMTLPDTFPKDLDFQWYIDETYRILNDIGVL